MFDIWRNFASLPLFTTSLLQCVLWGGGGGISEEDSPQLTKLQLVYLYQAPSGY
jgi:hypothetical protein